MPDDGVGAEVRRHRHRHGRRRGRPCTVTHRGGLRGREGARRGPRPRSSSVRRDGRGPRRARRPPRRAAGRRTPRCGSAGPARDFVEVDDRGRARRRRPRPRRRRRAGAGPRRRLQPAGRRRRLRRHRGPGRHPGHRARTWPPAPARSSPWPRASRGTPFVALHRRARRGAGWRPCRASPARSGRRPIQNVGAYGAEVGQHDHHRPDPRPPHRRRSGRFFAVECGFGYRTSRFKAEPGRYLVLVGDLPAAARLAVGPDPLRRAGPRARASRSAPGSPATEVRDAVLALRARARAWCSTTPTPTPGAPARSSPTRSSTPSGRGALPAGAPRFPQPDGRVKTSAAWLIEHAGFGRGYGDGPGPGVDQAHAGADQPRLGAARPTCSRWPGRSAPASSATFGITLVPEPVLVGCAL